MAVKGSPQIESVVVTVDRRRQRWFRILGVLGVVLALVVSYGLGILQGVGDQRQLQAEHRAHRALVEEQAQQLESLQRSLVNARVTADVDRESVEELRQLLKEQQQRQASLNQEIAFYKGLMSPTEREEGLSIRSFELYPGANKGRLAYKLIVQQLATKHVLLSGYITVEVVGAGPDGEQRLPLHTVSEQVGEANIKMRFKYFQTVEGELALPAGFRPQRVEVAATASKPKYARVDKQFGWVVQGG